MTAQLRLPATAAHVFVDAVATPDLSDDDAHHLMRVLRLRDGEAVTASDGRGSWRLCRVRAAGLDADGPVERQERPSPRITVAFAIVKGERPDWIVQKLTELGVDSIVPVAAERGVVRWDGARAARNLERFQVVARAAAMQSRRAWLPTVVGPVESASLPVSFPGIALAHPGGGRPSLERPAIAVGPEGGWSPAEVQRCGQTVDLGVTTLRAETAAVAAGVLLTALRSGLVGVVPRKST